MGTSIYSEKPAEKPHKELVEATVENLNKVLDKISTFAEEKGYILSAPIELPRQSVVYYSNSQRKLVRVYLTSLSAHVTMGRANRFLHLLFKYVYQEKVAPRVEYSERERKIRDSRKTWKLADITSQRLLKEYKDLKGDFYKKKTQAEKAA